MVENVYLKKAESDLSRAEHTLFVSLKYSRTADVLRSFLERGVETVNTIVDSLLKYEFDDGKIESIPENSGLKYEVVKKQFKEKQIEEMIEFCFYMKKLLRSSYTSSQEFRRHISLTFDMEGEEVIMKSDDAREHLQKIKGYLEFADELISDKEFEKKGKPE